VSTTTSRGQIRTDSGIDTHKFTGKERDSESNLDNFGARFDSSSLGRFMSPDHGPFHLANQQPLNRYAYALNNPLRFIDPGNWTQSIRHSGSTLNALIK
jgi:RHS repeat-associated protein